MSKVWCYCDRRTKVRLRKEKRKTESEKKHLISTSLKVIFCRFYLGPYDDDLAWIYFCLAKASFELEDSEHARDFIREADNIYGKVPGKDHSFYTQNFLPLKEMIERL